MITLQIRFNTWDEFTNVRDHLKPLNPIIGTVKKKEYYSTAKITIYRIPTIDTDTTIETATDE